MKKREEIAEPQFYIEEKEKNYPYKDKTIISEEEVFASLEQVKITKENALVLAKTLNKKY